MRGREFPPRDTPMSSARNQNIPCRRSPGAPVALGEVITVLFLIVDLILVFALLCKWNHTVCVFCLKSVLKICKYFKY